LNPYYGQKKISKYKIQPTITCKVKGLLRALAVNSYLHRHGSLLFLTHGSHNETQVCLRIC